MKIVSFSEIGRRNNNEDYIADGDFVFVLCDGVGGIAKGEVASKFVANSLVKKMEGINQSLISVALVQELIYQVQTELNLYLTNRPDCYGMGTTLCTVFISEKEVIFAHIGDSRIYFVKPKAGKYWRTTDHSMVAELVRSGIISEKDIRNHHLNNQITRAIQAIPEFEVAKPDITSVQKAEEGDLIFLCSDGVLEAFDDESLLDILNDKALSSTAKLELIQLKCHDLSSDNSSAILIEFEKVDEIIGDIDFSTDWSVLPNQKLRTQSDEHTKGNHKTEEDHKERNINKLMKIALYTFLILFIALITLSIIKKNI
jgi:protein phosphatase